MHGREGGVALELINLALFITTYLDEKPQSRSANKKITLGSSTRVHILEGGKLLLQGH